MCIRDRPEVTGADAGAETGPVITNTVKKKSKENNSSKYNRHLKKPDGEPFNRKDIQFSFIQELLMLSLIHI